MRILETQPGRHRQQSQSLGNFLAVQRNNTCLSLTHLTVPQALSRDLRYRLRCVQRGPGLHTQEQNPLASTHDFCDRLSACLALVPRGAARNGVSRGLRETRRGRFVCRMAVVKFSGKHGGAPSACGRLGPSPPEQPQERGHRRAGDSPGRFPAGTSACP